MEGDAIRIEAKLAGAAQQLYSHLRGTAELARQRPLGTLPGDDEARSLWTIFGKEARDPFGHVVGHPSRKTAEHKRVAGRGSRPRIQREKPRRRSLGSTAREPKHHRICPIRGVSGECMWLSSN